jgi:hypothetical protein
MPRVRFYRSAVSGRRPRKSAPPLQRTPAPPLRRTPVPTPRACRVPRRHGQRLVRRRRPPQHRKAVSVRSRLQPHRCCPRITLRCIRPNQFTARLTCRCQGTDALEGSARRSRVSVKFRCVGPWSCSCGETGCLVRSSIAVWQAVALARCWWGGPFGELGQAGGAPGAGLGPWSGTSPLASGSPCRPKKVSTLVARVSRKP